MNDESDDSHITLIDYDDDGVKDKSQSIKDMSGGNYEQMEQQLLSLWDNAKSIQSAGNYNDSALANSRSVNASLYNGSYQYGGNCGADNNFYNGSWNQNPSQYQSQYGGTCAVNNNNGSWNQDQSQYQYGGNCSANNGSANNGNTYTVNPSQYTMTYTGGYRTKGSKNRSRSRGSLDLDNNDNVQEKPTKSKRGANPSFMAFLSLVKFMQTLPEFKNLKRKDVIHSAKKVMDDAKKNLGDDVDIDQKLSKAKDLAQNNASDYL
jgi:hypothetical protein